MEELVETNKQLNDVVTAQKDMMSKLNDSIEALQATMETLNLSNFAQEQTIGALNSTVMAQESVIAAQVQSIQDLNLTASNIDGKLGQNNNCRIFIIFIIFIIHVIGELKNAYCTVFDIFENLNSMLLLQTPPP